MSRKSRTSLSSVEKLIEQRRLFQDWMYKLADGVEGMPPHVVERVRNDYRARLDGVMTELGEHSDGLREALEEAQLRHGGLDAQQQAKKDELAELRLRRHVGEMDDASFKEQSGVMKAALEGIQREVGAALRDIERFEEILELIAADQAPPPVVEAPVAQAYIEPPPRAAAPAAAAPAREAPRAPEPAPQAAAPEAPREPRRSSPDVAKPGPSVDELDFLRSVTTAAAAVKAAPAQDARVAPPAPPAREAPAPAPEPQRPGRPVREQAPAEPVGVAFEAAPGLLHLPPSEHDELEQPGAQAAMMDAKAEEDVALTCGECGAVNRPTEWYCEKCGAELASF